MNDVPVCRVEELPVGAHRVVRVGRREVGVFNLDQKLSATLPHGRDRQLHFFIDVPLQETGAIFCTEAVLSQ